MKKIAALLMTLLLISNLFAFTVSAAEVVISSVYPENKKNYSVGDTVKITGTCTVGKDLVLRIFNEKGSLIFTDVFLATDNTEGTFKFTNFEIPSTSSTGALSYKVVVSEVQDGEETKNIDTATMTVGAKKETSGGYETTAVMSSWVHYSPKATDEEKDIPAGEDPLNPNNQNKKLWDTVNGVNTEKEAENAIAYITKKTDTEDLKGETARNNVATAAETMVANIGSKTVKMGSGNKLSLSEASITTSDLSKLNSAMATIEKAIKDNKITLNREMSKELILNVKFNKNSKAKIAISKDLVDKLEKAKVDLLTIKDTDFRVSYTIKDLRNILGDENEVTFEIDKSGLDGTTKKISINFDTDKTQTMKISFPGLKGDTKYMAIVDENGKPVGGRYNPVTGEVEARISESGVYQVVNNERDFDDIKHLSEEMQESIKILAAKGIIEGTSAKEFSPEDSISRAEVAALLLRVLSQVDPNADGEFADVKKSDWFYGTAGSAKEYGMMVGFEDNTFRGNETIAKDQILTVASRVLKREMKYIAPEKPEEWLKYSDAESIAAWAADDIALVTMANIVTRTADNTIHANENMTRGDAALIIMRLFYKIW